MDFAILKAIFTAVLALKDLVFTSDHQVNYEIKGAIEEVEAAIGKSLPKAWEYWSTYKSETEWGNEMFFIWDARTHWAKAEGAIGDLQAHLKDELEKAEPRLREVGTWLKANWLYLMAGGVGISLLIVLAIKSRRAS